MFSLKLFVLSLHLLNFVLAIVGVRHVFKNHPGKKPLGLRVIYFGFPLMTFVNLITLYSTEVSPLLVWGVLPLIASAAVFIWTSQYIKKEGRLRLAYCGASSEKVHVTGPFSLVRHPFYLSYVLNFLGVALVFPTAATLLTAVGIASLYAITALKEERALTRGSLGKTYKKYQFTTPMIFPTPTSIARTIAGAPAVAGKIGELTQKSAGAFIFLALFDWILIAGITFIAIKTTSIPILIGSILAIGFLQHALAILGHDATHFVISKNQKLNDFIGNILCFYPLTVTLDGYRGFHRSHHIHLGKEGDPELPLRVVPPKTKNGFIGGFFIDLLGGAIPNLFRKAGAIAPKKPKDIFCLAVFWLTIVTASTVLGGWKVLLIWFLAFLTSFAAVTQFREYTEHYGISGSHRFKAEGLIQTILYPHQVWLHDEHHKFASVPCYNLLAVEPLIGEPKSSLAQVLKLAATERSNILGRREKIAI